MSERDGPNPELTPQRILEIQQVLFETEIVKAYQESRHWDSMWRGIELVPADAAVKAQFHSEVDDAERAVEALLLPYTNGNATERGTMLFLARFSNRAGKLEVGDPIEDSELILGKISDDGRVVTKRDFNGDDFTPDQLQLMLDIARELEPFSIGVHDSTSDPGVDPNPDEGLQGSTPND